MADIKSSMLKDAAFDGKDRLTVTFKNGGQYAYKITPDLYKKFEDTFQADDSTGKFFIEHIRHLPCEKL